MRQLVSQNLLVQVLSYDIEVFRFYSISTVFYVENVQFFFYE